MKIENVMSMTIGKLLEKEIPKETIVVAYNYNRLPVTGCLVCKHRMIEYGDKYCSNCGQALKWEEE